MSKAAGKVSALLVQAAHETTTKDERVALALRAARIFVDNDLRVVGADGEDEEESGPTIGDVANVADSIADMLGKFGKKKRR